MRAGFLAISLVASASLAAGIPGASAADAPAPSPSSQAIQATDSSGFSPSDYYQQILSLSAGTFAPRSAVISNGSYTFDYGNGPASASSSFLAEAGWAVRLFDAMPGSFYISENVAYTRFSGSPSSETVNGTPDTSLSVNLIGLDSRLSYSIERFPLKWFIPFAEGGYQVTFYSQTGASDLDSVQGETGNFVAGAGVRLWVNRHSSVDSDLKGVYNSIPVFVTLKWNRIFTNGASLDLADNGFMGGLSIGL